MSLGFVCLALLGGAVFVDGRVRVEVRHDDDIVVGAEVTAGGVDYVTDGTGRVTFSAPPGELVIVATTDGFAPSTASIEVRADETVEVILELERQLVVEEEVTVVATTRTGRRIEDQPMRVEVLDREEIEEKMLMTPGDIVMMLNETGGLRVAATSPSLGAASVRIQGMRGRYTRFLSDGLPLFGEQPGGLALLQIPPMDLGQVEVIKGMASALYGGKAMGGVVNLLSRRPGEQAGGEFLANMTSRGGQDGVVFYSGPITPTWSYSILGGGHRQSQTDVDGDDWADLAGYERGIVRPRLFWDRGDGRAFFLTGGATLEDRNGGTQPDAVLDATGEPYEEALDTRRYDIAASGQTIVGERFVLAGRAAFAQARHTHTYGEIVERDRHQTLFNELTLRGAFGRHTWIVGGALEHDTYRARDVPQFDYSFTTPGFFLQDDFDVSSWLTMSLSGRVDAHSEYGTFFSPRVSALVRHRGWSGRVSAGTGFFGPTPLTEETEAAGLTRLRVLSPLEAERGRSVSVDVARQHGPASVTVTLFHSRIDDSIFVDRTDGYQLRNLNGGVTNRGVELLATFRREPFVVVANYTYVDARETDGDTSVEVELTPRHSGGIVTMIENEDARLGIELHFTGSQRVEANPFRDTTEPYIVAGILAERRFGRVRLFINGENLTNTRQTKWDPLLRPTRNVDGRWTVDGWAPLEGVVVNGGIRIAF